MPKYVIWNKKHDKIAIYSTVVDDFVTGAGTPEELLQDGRHEDLINRVVFNICPYCETHLKPRVPTDFEIAVQKVAIKKFPKSKS